MSDTFLYYVVGRSGVGKDTVLSELRTRENATVAHRYITRDANAGSENHVALTEKEFKQRSEAGAFLFYWQAHGNQYGVGTEVLSWLNNGLSVFVNGSRHYLPMAKQKMGSQLISVLIDADDEVCFQRLLSRGRESEAEIKQRMQREAADPSQYDIVVDNSGSLENTLASIDAFLKGKPEKGSAL